MKQEGWKHSLWSFEARAQPQPVFLPSQRAPDKCRGPLNCDKSRAASNFKDFYSLGQHRAGATWQGGAGARVTDGDTDAQAGDRCAPLARGRAPDPGCCLSLLAWVSSLRDPAHQHLMCSMVGCWRGYIFRPQDLDLETAGEQKDSGGVK